MARTYLFPLFTMMGSWRGFQTMASQCILRSSKVTKKEKEAVFTDIPEHPVPSILTGFSAPICIDSDLSDADLYFLLANDSNEVNRWEAGQVLARKLMLNLVSDFQQNKSLILYREFLNGVKSVLSDPSLDKEFIAKAITLPGEGQIMDMMEVAALTLSMLLELSSESSLLLS